MYLLVHTATDLFAMAAEGGELEAFSIAVFGYTLLSSNHTLAFSHV